MNFHQHLDSCAQCRDHPFAPCPVGADLLERDAMPLELISVRLGHDLCCDICNPPHLADFERVCVRLRTSGCDRCICLLCIAAIARAVQGTHEQIRLDPEVAKFLEGILRAQRPPTPSDGTVH